MVAEQMNGWGRRVTGHSGIGEWRTPRSATRVLFVLLSLLGTTGQTAAFTEQQAFTVNQEEREVIAYGWVQAHRFNTDVTFYNNLPRYHAIVAAGGSESQVPVFVMVGRSDEFYHLLLDVAATPGESFTAYNQRNSHGGNPFGDARVTGSTVEITVSWPGSEKWYRLNEIIDDPGQRGFYMRFAGNKKTINTGCFTCLYSCPGGRVSNERYSIEDYTDGVTQFTAREDILPPDGTPVFISFKVVD